MRLILAGLFVFGGLIVAVILLWLAGLDDVPAVFIAPIMTVVIVGLLAAAIILFNKPGAGLTGPSRADEIRDLEEKGLLTEQRYQATRGLVVEEMEDEGVHYFIELANGAGVLFLGGQYLWDYEYDSATTPATRRFPSTEFVVRRHVRDGYGVDVRIEGPVVTTVDVARPFTLDDFKSERVPRDGTVIVDVSYDEIKRRLLNR